MTVASLLPGNRTPWETALSTVNAERSQLPTSLAGSLWNPDTCPADLLGWMAEQFSLDVWDESWPEVTKREAIRNAPRLHRLKTTLAGIKAHVALAGSEVRRAIRPPASGFLYAAMDSARRAEWLDSLPQVRIYPYFYRSIAKSRNFGSGPGGRQFHIGFRRPSRGGDLLGKRATLYDGGVEVAARYESVDGGAAERVYIAAARDRSWHRAGLHTRPFLKETKAKRLVVTIHADDAGSQFAVVSGMEPVNVLPQRVNQSRVAPAARSFYGRHPKSTFMLSSFGALLVYEKVSLNDPSRMGARRKVRAYHGHGRFGIDDYTSELRIHVPMRRAVRRSGRWHKSGFRVAASMDRLQKAIQAVRVSKAFRDTVLIDTATFGRVRFAGGLRFGQFTFGEIKEVA